MNTSLHWRKSSHSGGIGQSDCVELADLAPHWCKSSHSAGEGESDCIELADLALTVGVRDSKDTDGPKLTFSRAEFAAFVGEIKAGRLG